MPRLLGFVLAIVMCLVATLGLISGIYGLLTGSYMRYGLEFIVGTFFGILVFYYAAYKSWTKDGATDKQKEREILGEIEQT